MNIYKHIEFKCLAEYLSGLAKIEDATPVNKRMKITVHSEGHLTLEHMDEDGHYVSREFASWGASNKYGGYVYERYDGEWHQTCEGLYDRGVTLMIYDDAKLPDIIRREYRAMRREWARAQREYYGAPR